MLSTSMERILYAVFTYENTKQETGTQIPLTQNSSHYPTLAKSRSMATHFRSTAIAATIDFPDGVPPGN